MTDQTETGPARQGSTERCSNPGCGHTKRDHSGRRDHQAKGYRADPWCHACETPCLYEPPTAAAPAVPAGQAPATDRGAVLLEAATFAEGPQLGIHPELDAVRLEIADGLRRMAAEPAAVSAVPGQADGETTDEARLARVREWVTSDVVTARNEFGNGYREAQRDIRDLITGAEQPAAGAQQPKEA